MSFLTIRFAIFVAIMLIAYYTVCKNNQWLLLLCGSLVFYCYASPYYLVFVGFSIVTAYMAGIYMEKGEESRKKLVMILCLLANIMILLVLKYTGFFMDNIVTLLNKCGANLSVPKVNFILPLGISYYTFMTISYLCDVYWGVCKAQNSFFQYALFILYFPHITQGPIDSYTSMENSLYTQHSYDKENITTGLYRILVGLFKKLVIASRLSVYVDAVYADPTQYAGLTLAVATFFYAIQMYCDFSGYMDMAVGISKLFGIEIFENFDLPYFSKSIPEYWRRWHITLGVFFRTYIFYPVIRSRLCKSLTKSIKKKYNKALASMITTIIGLICVWLLTGFWHGASWHYVMHGVYHGLIIIISTILASSYKRWKELLHISDDSKLYHVFAIVRTFILVDISYILFRASNLTDAGYIIKKILHMSINTSEIKAAILPFTQDNTAVSYAVVVMTAILMLFLAECSKYNGSDFIKKHRGLTVSVMVLMTLLFGVFGQSSFLYAAY